MYIYACICICNELLYVIVYVLAINKSHTSVYINVTVLVVCTFYYNDFQSKLKMKHSSQAGLFYISASVSSMIYSKNLQKGILTGKIYFKFRGLLKKQIIGRI